MCYLRLGLALCIIFLLAAALVVDTDQMYQYDDDGTAAGRLENDNFESKQLEAKNTPKQVLRRQKRFDSRRECCVI